MTGARLKALIFYMYECLRIGWARKKMRNRKFKSLLGVFKALRKSMSIGHVCIYDCFLHLRQVVHDGRNR